jgi:hypothetical protein
VPQRIKAEMIPLQRAVLDYGLSRWKLYRLVDAGVLTRGRWSPAAKQPPIHLSVKELDAYARGGVDAVERVKARAKKRRPAK